MKNSLIIKPIVVLIFALFVLFSTLAFAQKDELESVPIPIPPKHIDLSGTWNYKTTQPNVSGRCPAGTALAGTAVITQKSNEVTLKYMSGAKCRPATVCFYTGVLNENNFLVSNTVKVDYEGGEVSSAISLIIFNNESAKGFSTNHYVHPKGFECRWNMDVIFTRKLDK